MSFAVKRFPRMDPTPYSQARGEIRSGDVLICSGSSWISRMIQRATHSVWSHVAFVMRLDQIDRIMVLESVEHIGVRTVPLSKYLTDYDSRGNPYPGRLAVARHRRFEELADPKALARMGRFAVDLFGYPYDREMIAKILARIVSAHLPFSPREQKALGRDREFICSEYVWECYHAVGIDIPYDPLGFIAPADFARAKELELKMVLQ